MASQIKLKLESCDYKDNDNVTSTRNLIIDWNEKELFSIKEFDCLKATFTFDENEYEIWYELFDSDELQRINNGETFQLSYGTEDKGCYFPGYFTIVIQTRENRHEFLFFVEPQNANYQDVVKIRDYVNSFYHGLSANILRKKVGGELFSNEHLPNANENYSFMCDKLPTLFNYFNQYLAARKVELIKEKVISPSGKVDSDTVKWLSKKGASKNENINNPDKLLVTKTTTVLDNGENQTFKSELLFWNQEINKVLANLKKILEESNRRKLELEKSISDSELKLSKIKDAKFQKKVSDKTKIAEENYLRNFKSDYNVLESYINQYEKSYETFKHFKLNIETMLYTTWLKNIHIQSNEIKRVSDNRLKLIKTIRNEYLGIKESINKGKKRIAFGEKCTPKLFETYIYVLLLNILTEKGYTLMSHNIENDDLVPVLSNPGKVTLEKDDSVIDIYYDTLLKKSDEIGEEGFVNINSDHDRPDFIIAYRNGDDIKAIIIDAKWRPFSAIYDEIGDTDIIRQMKDYYNFAYKAKSKKVLERGVIEKVVAIFPNEKEDYHELAFGNAIAALGIYPKEDMTTSGGYQKLMSLIEELELNDKNL